jgi:hypothetical protein
MNRIIFIAILATQFFVGYMALAQSPDTKRGRVWMQGASVTFTTTFDSGRAPNNQLIYQQQSKPPYLFDGNSNICDTSGNLLLVSDGYRIYDSDLKVIDGGQLVVPACIAKLNEFSLSPQSSIFLPFANNKYLLVTPTVSDTGCYYNWHQVHTGAVFDLLLYDEIDMNANGGKGKVTKSMVPLMEGARLSKSQMMACRHGDGKSWWILNQASDTNVVYKFLLTEEKVYGPYIQGFGGAAAYFGVRDLAGQSMFSQDGTLYATAIEGSGKVFVADFDRCSGALTNPRVYKVPAAHTGNPFDPMERDSSSTGLCFSPNGKYLYVAGFFNIHQLELQSGAWTFLSGPDTTYQIFQWYSNIYPGPDHKLYIGNWHGFSAQWNVINTPDSPGAAAGFCRKCCRFPGFLKDTTIEFLGAITPPCMPNYNLGPTNPICYPVGVKPSPRPVAFSLFPNPASSYVTIRYEEAGELQLYNTLGSLVAAIELSGNNESTSLSIDHLLPGIYHYIYTSEHGGSKSGTLAIAF